MEEIFLAPTPAGENVKAKAAGSKVVFVKSGEPEQKKLETATALAISEFKALNPASERVKAENSSAVVQFAMDISSFDGHDYLPDSEEFYRGPWDLKEGDKREKKRKRKKQQKAVGGVLKVGTYIHTDTASDAPLLGNAASVVVLPLIPDQVSIEGTTKMTSYSIFGWRKEKETPPHGVLTKKTRATSAENEVSSSNDAGAGSSRFGYRVKLR